MWVPAKERADEPQAHKQAVDEMVLREDLIAAAAQVPALKRTIAGAELVRVDLDLGEMDDDILAALEMPGLRLVSTLGGIDEDEAAAAAVEPEAKFGLGTMPDNFLEVVYRKGLRRKRGKKKTADADDWDDDDDNDGDEAWRQRYRQGDENGSRFGGSQGGRSSWGGSQAGRRNPVQNSFLEQQLSAVMGQYDDDEIGELDEEDSGARGLHDISAFDELLDEHMAEHVAVSTLRTLYGSGAVAAGPRVAAELEALERAGGGGDVTERPVAMSAEARARLALVPEEADEGEYDAHPFLTGLDGEEDNAAEKWDCETIVSTYSNTENHPTLVRVRQKMREQRIQLGPLGLPVGRHALPGVKATASKLTASKLPAGLASERAGGDEDEESDSDEDGQSVATDLSTGTRQRGESAEEKRARKTAVKTERRNRREEKKQTKEIFSKERTKNQHVVSRAQPTGIQI